MCVFFIVCAGTADKWEGVKYIFYKDLDFLKKREETEWHVLFVFFFFFFI